MGVKRFHHCLCWHPNLPLPIRLLENFEAYQVGSTISGRHSNGQGGARCCGLELARAKTEEHARKGVVLDCLKKGARFIFTYFYCNINHISSGILPF